MLKSIIANYSGSSLSYYIKCGIKDPLAVSKYSFTYCNLLEVRRWKMVGLAILAIAAQKMRYKYHG